MARMNESSVILQRDLKAALVEAHVRREEQERVRMLVGEVRREVIGVKGGLQRNERDGERMERELRELVEENRGTRSVWCSGWI